ncbi:UNVERIFIED_CONTAM: hypothetical protein GTU68_001439 [Idotea baltica]|nr:hypothetical protein [Idotea baltica]
MSRTSKTPSPSTPNSSAPSQLGYAPATQTSRSRTRRSSSCSSKVAKMAPSTILGSRSQHQKK